VIAVELPRSHTMMHRDTVMTMIDRATFVPYPDIGKNSRSWSVTAGDQELRVRRNHTLAEAIGAAADHRRDIQGLRA
jgi:arginine deiminase